MDPDYQLDAGTAAAVANLTGLPIILAEATSVPVVVGTTSPRPVTEVPSTFSPSVTSTHTTPAGSSATSWSPTPSWVSGRQPGDTSGDLGRRLEEGLHQLQEGLRHLNQPPTVVVVNQPAPNPPAGWHQEMDGAVAGSLAAVILIILIAAGCLLLRRFRPQMWKRIKGVAIQALQWAALPISWAFSKAADALRQFHHATVERAETEQQAAALQV